MGKDVRIVKLRDSGLQARISIIPKSEQQFLSGYIFAPSKQSYHSQIIYFFCENWLKDIVPQLISMTKDQRQKTFDELYSIIISYNPDIDKLWKPTMQSTRERVMKVKLIPVGDELQLEIKTAKKKTVTPAKVEGLERHLNSVVFGQEKAIAEIQEKFNIAITGLGDSTRPRGSFIFIGNSGTGKTLSVKEIAKYLFGNKWRNGIYVINGSEFLEDHEVSKLTSAPPGYVGYDDGSPFLKHVKKYPETVILVDEFEKATPRLQDIFLQVLDEGAFYSNKGERIDFSETFIVFTSNIGTKEIYHANPVGFSNKPKDLRESLNKAVSAALKGFCRVEFIKRFDGIVIFDELEQVHYEKMCKVEILKIEEKLSEKRIRFSVDEALYPLLVSRMEEGDTAREINSIVKKEVSSEIARLLIKEPNTNWVKVMVDVGEIRVESSVGEINGKEQGKSEENSG